MARRRVGGRSAARTELDSHFNARSISARPETVERADPALATCPSDLGAETMTLSSTGAPSCNRALASGDPSLVHAEYPHPDQTGRVRDQQRPASGQYGVIGGAPGRTEGGCDAGDREPVEHDRLSTPTTPYAATASITAPQPTRCLAATRARSPKSGSGAPAPPGSSAANPAEQLPIDQTIQQTGTIEIRGREK